MRFELKKRLSSGRLFFKIGMGDDEGLYDRDIKICAILCLFLKSACVFKENRYKERILLLY